MFTTDESTNYIATLQFIIYYLVYKLGGEAKINFAEIATLFEDDTITRSVADTPYGLAFRVEKDWQKALDKAFD